VLYLLLGEVRKILGRTTPNLGPLAFPPVIHRLSAGYDGIKVSKRNITRTARVHASGATLPGAMLSLGVPQGLTPGQIQSRRSPIIFRNIPPPGTSETRQ